MASTATGYSDMAPSPRVVIDVDPATLNPAAATVIVRQISKWGDVPVNRSPRAVAGGLVVVDYEVPPGVPVTYRVEQFDASGNPLGMALSLTTQVDVGFGRVVVSDPLAPANAVILDADPDFAGVLSRSRPGVVYQAGGESFALSGLRSGFAQVTLRCYTDTAEERARLEAVLAEPMILVRTHPDMNLPGAFYAFVSRVAADSRDHARFGRKTTVWDFEGDEVTRPGIDVLVPVYSYALYKAYLDEKYPPVATYADAATEWGSYIAAMRNPPTLV